MPQRYIFANKEFIDNISKDSKVYLLCRNGNRSRNIKNKYFKNNDNVISIEGGLKSLEQFGDKIELVFGKGGFGMLQYMQFVFAFVIIGTIIAIYMNVKKLYLMIGLGLFVAFIFQFLHFIKNCST